MTNETIELEAVHLPVASLSEAEESVGGFASVEGEAVTREHGAAVSAGELLVEVPEANPWPEDVVGRRVIVRGRLAKTERGWALDGTTYELVEE